MLSNTALLMLQQIYFTDHAATLPDSFEIKINTRSDE